MLHSGFVDEVVLEEVQVEYNHPIPIYFDNTSAIIIYKNLVLHSKTKHMPIKCHFIREQVSKQKVKLEYVNTKEHGAGFFTKPSSKDAFKYFRKKLGVISLLN